VVRFGLLEAGGPAVALVIGEIIGDAERRLAIPRDVSAESIRTALGLDSTLPRPIQLEFLERALPLDTH
jgi:hypothetical protein